MYNVFLTVALSVSSRVLEEASLMVQAEQGEELTATPTEAAPAQTAVTQA